MQHAPMRYVPAQSMTQIWMAALWLGLCSTVNWAAEPPGVIVRTTPATPKLQLDSAGRFAFQISCVSSEPSKLQVELPDTGRHTWPIEDVEVLDGDGRPVAVTRGGIQWHKLTIPLRPGSHQLTVHVVDPSSAPPKRFPEPQRHVADEVTGLTAHICRWRGGKQAALSIRFDDSHPTHLSLAAPVLDEYGFRGTFMVNPGGHPPNSRRRSAFETQRAQWEALAKTQRHEFANHTLHHRGAANDRDMDEQIGQASREIWKLFPNRSRLLALNLGGGTTWTTTKTLRHYLDQHHLFVTGGSTGMDDVYGNRVSTFRRLLAAHIERGIWYRIHYHSIGENQGASEEHFREVLDVAKQHEAQLWIAGMADIYKHQTSRQSASLTLTKHNDESFTLKQHCATAPALYDQPLTIELSLPKSWPPARVRLTSEGRRVETTSTNDGRVLRFDAAPRDVEFNISVDGD